MAIAINAELNHVDLDISTENLIGQTNISWDTVLLGDMFYDMDFGVAVAEWIEKLHMCGTHVLIGDPERITFLEHSSEKEAF